jgi:hypothetical protein
MTGVTILCPTGICTHGTDILKLAPNLHKENNQPDSFVKTVAGRMPIMNEMSARRINPNWDALMNGWSRTVARVTSMALRTDQRRRKKRPARNSFFFHVIASATALTATMTTILSKIKTTRSTAIDATAFTLVR